MCYFVLSGVLGKHCLCPHTQQAAALVNIYKDGSVLVTHGGAEMGQGVHTKMQQVCQF